MRYRPGGVLVVALVVGQSAGFALPGGERRQCFGSPAHNRRGAPVKTPLRSGSKTRSSSSSSQQREALSFARKTVAVHAGGASSFATTVAPTLGAVIANAMFLTSLPAVLNARKEGDLKALNPIPFAFIFANCLAWLHYSYVMRNPYAFLSNALGAVLGLFYTLTGMKLGSQPQRAQLECIAIGLAAVHVVASYFSTFVLHTVAQRQALTGYVANAVLILLYGAPLSTLKQVLKTKSAASIFAPLSIVSGLNGALWVVYGLAIKDLFLAIPNGLGLVLAITQIGFKLVFK